MKDIRKLSQLHEWKNNPRNINTKDFARLKEQIKKLGQYKPLLVTPDGEVIGGNMRLKAYRELGMDEVWVSVVTPKDENEKLEYALSDNDRAGYYDEDMLANLIPNYDIDWSQYAVDLKPPDDIQKLIDSIAPVEEDEAPEVSQDEPVSRLGEVYQLGRHRLMCGDSTKIEDVEKLMDGQKADLILTDPPYGVDYVGKTKESLKIENDAKTSKDMHDFWVLAFSNMNAVSKLGCAYYCCSSQGGEMMMMMMSLFDSGFLVKQQIIWNKNTLVMGHSDYQFKHEPLFYGWKKDGSHQFYGDRTQTSVWDINKPSASRDHPTMKPVELFIKPIKNSSKSDDIVLDLFLGSGTTVIASEQTGRMCYGMEYDPKYCDVIRKRYAKFIGKEDIWQETTPIIK